MKNKLKKLLEIYEKKCIYKYLFWIVDLPYYFVRYFIDDETLIRYRYKRVFKREPEFINYNTLNEYIHHRSLFEHNELFTKCADKYLVRDYVKDRVGEQYLIPLIDVVDKVDEIDYEKLPKEFVLKVNHGSGQNILVWNKENIDKKEVACQLNYWLKRNHYYSAREWQYKNIKPKIIIEKLLVDKNGNIPDDIKFHCFDGKIEFIQVDTDRFTTHKRVLYNTKWEKQPFLWSPADSNGEPVYKLGDGIKRPKKLDEMIFVAEKLSKDFKYVRVDLYLHIDNIYFGELTFTHGGGLEKFFPEKYDYILKKRLDKSKKI